MCGEQQGADQSANMEIVLWVAAIEHWNARAGKYEKELTNAQWVTVREALATELALSGPDKPLDEIVSRVSGGLERTRSLLREAQEDNKLWSQALVPLLASASHGLTNTPYLDSFLLALLGSQTGDTIYCPFLMGLSVCLFPSGLPDIKSILRHRTIACAIGQNYWRSWVTSQSTTRCNDPLRNPSWVSAGKLDAFEYSAAIPSFGYRPKMESLEDKFRRFPLRLLYGEALQLAHVLAQTAKRAVVVMPEGFLFRTAGGEQKFKEMLVRKETPVGGYSPSPRYIHAIIKPCRFHPDL